MPFFCINIFIIKKNNAEKINMLEIYIKKIPKK